MGNGKLLVIMSGRNGLDCSCWLISAAINSYLHYKSCFYVVLIKLLPGSKMQLMEVVGYSEIKALYSYVLYKGLYGWNTFLLHKCLQIYLTSAWVGSCFLWALFIVSVFIVSLLVVIQLYLLVIITDCHGIKAFVYHSIAWKTAL